VIYLATASGPTVCEAIAAGRLGQLVTPDAGNRPIPGARWALDNGCFSNRWTVERWGRTLDRHADTPGCLWATVPDVVGNAETTEVMWRRWWSAPMRRGYRAAWVAQDGCRRLPTGPKAVFIGGTTAWKLGPHARAVIRSAKARGIWVHMGRVNSLRRLRYAHAIGCDSVDGTYLTYAPETNLRRLLAWLDHIHTQQTLDLDAA
jgi:hypothetical protein